MACDVGQLAAVPLFAQLSAETKAATAEATTLRHFRRGMFVFTEGEAPEGFHFIIEGRVRVFRDTPDGHEQTLQIVDDGGLLAVVCFVEGTPYPASAQTLADAVIGSIRNADLTRLVHERGDLGWTMLVQFARRLLWAQGRMYDLGLRGAAGRIASALLQLGREHGQPGPDGRVTVDLPLTHREIGELTSVSRETVTRTLKQFRQAGALEWTADGLVVLDPQALTDWQDS